MAEGIFFVLASMFHSWLMTQNLEKGVTDISNLIEILYVYLLGKGEGEVVWLSKPLRYGEQRIKLYTELISNH